MSFNAKESGGETDVSLPSTFEGIPICTGDTWAGETYLFDTASLLKTQKTRRPFLESLGNLTDPINIECFLAIIVSMIQFLSGMAWKHWSRENLSEKSIILRHISNLFIKSIKGVVQQIWT